MTTRIKTTPSPASRTPTRTPKGPAASAANVPANKPVASAKPALTGEARSSFDTKPGHGTPLPMQKPLEAGRIPGLAFHQAHAIAAHPAEQPAQLPAWVPAGTDFKKIGLAARSILEAQGCAPVSFGKNHVESIVFTDADHTMMKTTTPVLLRNQVSGDLVHHPRTGKLIKLPSKDYKDALAALQKEFPSEPWKDIEFDYRGMASAVELKRTPGIASTLEMLRDANAQSKGREFIITARSADNIPVAFDYYTAARGVELDGVFPVNGPNHLKTLGIDAALPTPHKKAIIMASLIDLYGPSALKEVRFFEDGDANLVAAMELLPRMYPHIAFEFVDVVHDGNQHFSQQIAGISPSGTSGLQAEDGSALSERQVRNYRSDDVPI